MRRSKTILAGATAGLFAVSAAGFAASPNDQVQTFEGQRFACTGVGNDAQNDPRWDDFPLKMVFTNDDGDYLGDVSVTLSNEAGDVVLAAQCAAPWLVANLQDGSYSATLVARGQYDRSVDFTVGGAGQTQVVVPFPGISGT